MLGVMAWCMPLFVAASTFGSLNAIIFTAARSALEIGESSVNTEVWPKNLASLVALRLIK